MTYAYPASIRLRPIDALPGDGSELRLYCIDKNAQGGMLPWALMLDHGIPNRLANGGSDVNRGDNVSMYVWQSLNNGGMGYALAKDPSTFRYTVGLYTGDEDEIYCQPQFTAFTKDSGIIPSGQTIRQVVPWTIPVLANATTAPASLTIRLGNNAPGPYIVSGTTYYYQVTALVGGKESVASNEVSIAVVANSIPYLNWNAVTGATGYRVYRSAATGTGGKQLVKEVTGNTVYNASEGNYRCNDNGYNEPKTNMPSASSNTAPASIQRRMLVLSADASQTYLNHIPYDWGGTGPALGGHISSLTYNNGLSDAGVGDAAGGALAYFSGVMNANAATIYRNDVWLPTLSGGKPLHLHRIYYDDARATYKIQMRPVDNVLGHMVYGDGDRRLWVFNHNLAYYCAEPTAPSPEWKGPIAVGSKDWPVQSALVFGGTKTADSGLYVAKADGLYRILDTETGPSQRAEFVASFGIADSLNGLAMWEHKGELFIAGRAGIYRYSLGSIDIATNNKGRGLPVALRGFPVAGCSTGRHVYSLLHGNGELAAYQTINESEAGEAWHQVMHSAPIATFNPDSAATSDRWQGRSLVAVGNDFTVDASARLVFSGGQNNDQLYWLPVRRAGERIREASGYVPVQSGQLALGVYYTDHKAVEKVWYWAQANQKLVDVPAPDQPKMTLQVIRYRPGLAEYSYTSLGTVKGEAASYVNAPGFLYVQHSLRREISSKGLIERGLTVDQVVIPARSWSSDGIGIVMTLDRGTSTTVSPVVEDIAIAYGESQQALRRWTYNCEISKAQLDADRNVVNPDAAQVQVYLETLLGYAANNRALLLTDFYGNDYIVRLDIGNIRPDQYRTQRDNVGTVYAELLSATMTLTFTELYNPTAYSHLGDAMGN